MIAKYLEVTPQVTWLPEYNPVSHPGEKKNEWANIKALTYEGAERGGQKTKIFAYLGYPEKTPAPAMVLVHGGGGQPYAEWVKRWTDRGFVAIAPSNTGFFPTPAGKGKAGREVDFFLETPYWQQGLHGDFLEPGFVSAPDNDGMQHSDAPQEEQWIYHAIINTVLARRLLQQLPEVNGTVGLTGTSWGGVITALVLGYDPFFSFAIPVYGSAYLEESLGWMGPIFREPKTQENWSAGKLLQNSGYPILWQGYTMDPPFSLQSHSHSFLDTASRSYLSFRMDMGHSHSCAWNAPEGYRYAGAQAFGAPGLPTPETFPMGERDIRFLVALPVDARALTARLCYITEPMTYPTDTTKGPEQTFLHIPLTVEVPSKAAADNTKKAVITGTVPPEAHSYYVELTLLAEGELITATPFVAAK